MGELRTQESFGGDTQASHTYQDTVYSKLRPGEALHASRPDAVRLVFVGPSEQQGKLERCALKIDDLRLRPDVIFNFLTIHYLHGGPTPPTLAEVQAVIKEHGGRKRTLRSTRGTCST